MTLTRWNARPRTHLPNWADEFFNPSNWENRNETRPEVNVRETKESYVVELSSPGMKKEDFNLEVEDGNLVVSAEKKTENEDEREGNYLRKEFTYKSFERKFLLPDHIDEEHIKAQYVDGILNVSIPKKAEEQPKKKVIEIG